MGRLKRKKSEKRKNAAVAMKQDRVRDLIGLSTFQKLADPPEDVSKVLAQQNKDMLNCIKSP